MFCSLFYLAILVINRVGKTISLLIGVGISGIILLVMALFQFVFSDEIVSKAMELTMRAVGFMSDGTINQFFPDGFVQPKHGVYASYVEIGGKAYPAVTNFGRRPTIGTPSVRSETCILGFSGDLYGTDTEVHLLEFLRAEKKFDGLSSLSAQIKADSESAVKIFENTIAKNA